MNALKNRVSNATGWAAGKVATVVALGTAGATSANAAAVDVTSVVTDIGAQMASIVAVGAAVLIIYAGVKAFKWVRAAMS